MTELEKYLSEVKARAEKATPGVPTMRNGEWNDETLRIAHQNGGLARVTYQRMCDYRGRDHETISAQFIEEAIKTATADIPRLLAIVERQRAALSRIRLKRNMTGMRLAAGIADQAFEDCDRIAAEGGEG